jgi:uncharacterized heparinase superfamily protein
MAAGPSGATRLPGQTLALALTAGVGRRLHREWIASALRRALVGGGGRIEGFSVHPKDMRPTDPEAGARLLSGSFVLAGAALQSGPKGDPWDRPSPHRRFAVALHRFTWMPDLLATGAAGRGEGLRLYLEWRRLFGRWNAFAWAPEVLERRVFNLACAAKWICGQASDAETALIARDLVRQGRYLLDSIDGPERAAERAACAALAGCAVSGEAGVRLRVRALARLAKALPRTVLPDGGHASRSPQAALELLFDLQTLDEALAQRGLASPEEVTRAIDRLTGLIWFLTLSDGGLPAFQGGEELSRHYVAAARAAEDETAPRQLPAMRNGYHRLDGKTLQVIVDAAPPPTGPFSLNACAQPLAVEILAGGRRLITNCGWSPDAAGPQALRLIDAASTATLGDQPCGEILSGLSAALLGPRLDHAFARIGVDRREAAEGVWLEVSHDAWSARYRMVHRRRIYVDPITDELRGEDRFDPLPRATASNEKVRRFVPIAVCFHVHPGVRASLALDKKSVLLRAEGQDVGWWLRNDAAEVSVEASVHFHNGLPRRSQRVVLRGQARTDVAARIRWKLARAELKGRAPAAGE